MCRLFLFMLLILFFCCSCSEDPIYPRTLDNTNRFEKRLQADLSLECGRVRLDYVSGKKGQKMTFVLKNKGLTPVSIDEWYMEDSENIRLYFASCEKGKAANVKESDWVCVWPLKKEIIHGRHMPVCLNPNQGLLLDVPMAFLKSFPQRKPVEYIAVRAELALKSVAVQSPVYEIEVRPMVYQY